MFEDVRDDLYLIPRCLDMLKSSISLTCCSQYQEKGEEEAEEAEEEAVAWSDARGAGVFFSI
jgi:hypothetical protein